MSETAYVIDGTTVTTTTLAAGPWDPRLQHGGAPSSLAAWAAEQVPTQAPMRIARATIDLFRPVPVADLGIDTTVLREGRKIQLVQVRLLAGDAEVVRATILKVRTVDQPLPGEVRMPPLTEAMPEQVAGVGMGIPASTENFGANFEIRRIQGGFSEPGPGKVWFRQHRALISGQPLSPAMRAVAVADFSNGISALLPFAEWTFINGDLTVSLAREPVGEWIYSEAETWAAPDGIGSATARLADRHGFFGQAIQSLVLERRG
ncbi:thioesterase family protein [Sphingomonas tabacisoli]|uniref:Thioesterase family protein n=1 Tax=Sphingomonas tabacisoli TaxID=2249466 RepID=A0ABW4HZS1_9SPHN